MKTTQSTPSTAGPPGWLWPALASVLVAIAIIAYAVNRMHTLPIAAVQSNAVPTAAPPRLAGSHAPPLSLQTRMGPITSDSLAGKPYMLELFATWCPHCQRMTAVLKKLRTQIPESRFAMLSVDASPYAMNATPSSPTSSSQADVDQFDATFGVTWPSIFDPDLSVARTWGLSGFPQLYIVNGRGIITYAHSGEVPAATLLAAARKAGA